MKALAERWKQRFSNPFIRNASWLGSAELANRIFRLGTTVTLARLFTPADYGLLALLYMVQSFSSVLTFGAGMGDKIIQVDQESLEETCNTAYWLNWILCVSIFIVQCLLSFVIARVYQNNQLILPICMVGLKYLTLPIFNVQLSLIKRENRLKILALIHVCESMIANILTIILAILGLGIWSVVWATVMSIAARIVVSYWHHPWRPPTIFHLGKWQEIFGFSFNVLGVRLLDKLRLNLDYLIVGFFWNEEILGLYFFAFNAGIGISKNVINVLVSSLYPYLCEVRTHLKALRGRYFHSLRRMMLVIVPLVILQSLSAPIYVPIIFGPQWENAIPILQLVCLSAIPLSIAVSVNQLLNALDKTRINLIWNGIYTILFAIALLFSIKFGVMTVAIAVLIAQCSTLLFSIWAMRYVFKASMALPLTESQ